jgi:hypothetical protein
LVGGEVCRNSSCILAAALVMSMRSVTISPPSLQQQERGVPCKLMPRQGFRVWCSQCYQQLVLVHVGMRAEGTYSKFRKPPAAGDEASLQVRSS